MILSVTPDIKEALRANPAALSAFEALPPSHKAEYLKWIEEAKKPDTRARRIQGMIEKLQSGPGSPKRLAERALLRPHGQSVGPA